MIAPALTFAAIWITLALTLTGIYARAATARRRALATYAARVRYSTEALTLARQRAHAGHHNPDLWRNLGDAA